ncbi:MAG: phosphopentomutase [Verrucomicrobiales bacterium]
MPKRAVLIVLDSVGIGHAPDASAYGDAGADTLGHILKVIPDLKLPNLDDLGLAMARAGAAVETPVGLPARVGAAATWMTEASAGKDTTTGHWELAGAVLDEPFATFEQFPQDLVEEIGASCGVRFLGNVAASGTEILDRLGAEHLATGNPILYTSADSVLQIAAHEEAFGLDRLYLVCKKAREILDQRGLRIGRVIARPFLGSITSGFQRTSNRHDYSLKPPPTVLDAARTAGVKVIGVGKISDIFAGQGIDESHPTRSNAHGMETLDRLTANPPTRDELIFANLVDFDMLFGHRRDPAGYARALLEFDGWLGLFLARGHDDGFLMITADHGNDPTWSGTDHTRERVPLLTVASPRPLETGTSFSQVADLLSSYFSLPRPT